MLAALHQLAPGVRRRDPDAVAGAYRVLADLVASVAVGLLGDRAAAEDIVQETFLRLVRHAQDLRDDDGRVLRAWVVRTARNLCLDRLRSAHHRRETPTGELPEAVTDAAPAPEGISDPEVAAALAELTDDQRQAVLLFHVAGLSGAEVARILGRNRAAVYTLLRRAERRLRRLLVPPSDPGPDTRLQPGGSHAT